MFILGLAPISMLIYFISEKLRINYPDQYNNYLISLSYNIIYYFSTIQINLYICYNFIQKIVNNFLINVLEKYPESNSYINKVTDYFINKNNENKNLIEFFSNGHVIYSINKDEFIVDRKKLFSDFFLIDLGLGFDYVIYSELNNNIINKKFIRHFPNEQDLICEETTYKFILIELEIKCKDSTTDYIDIIKEFKIDFLINNHNYYIVNNIIDINFIHYFLNTYYSEDIKNLDINNFTNFTLKVLDQNIEELCFDNKSNLFIKKNNCDIFIQEDYSKENCNDISNNLISNIENIK